MSIVVNDIVQVNYLTEVEEGIVITEEFALVYEQDVAGSLRVSALCPGCGAPGYATVDVIAGTNIMVFRSFPCERCDWEGFTA